MRIALVVPGGVSRDGEFKVIPAILSLLERLTPRHDVQVVVPRQEDHPGKWELRGATVNNVGGWNRTWRFRAIAGLKRLHEEAPFDVFHAIWAQGPGEVALIAGHLCDRPVAVHVAGGELVWLPEVPFGSRRPWRGALSRWVIRNADVVTTASQTAIDLVARTAGVRAIRVPLGADLACWRPIPPRRRTLGTPGRLVSVGSLTAVKDQDTLLRAVADLVTRGRDVRLDLVGEDRSRGRITGLVQELGIADRVVMHGFLPQRAAHEVVRKADLLIVSSRHEIGPVAMVEAAAVGVPTVGTPVGHVAEWAPSASVVVPFAAPASMASAIDLLLSDEDRRLALASNAQARALAEDADWTAGRFEGIYRQLQEDRIRARQ